MSSKDIGLTARRSTRHAKAAKLWAKLKGLGPGSVSITNGK